MIRPWAVITAPLKLLTFLTQGPPPLYILLYLLLIPTFADIYFKFCKDGFYAPYAHLEPAWMRDSESLIDLLQRDVALGIRYDPEAGTKTFPDVFPKNEARVIAGSITVTELQPYKDADVEFSVNLRARVPDHSGFLDKGEIIELGFVMNVVTDIKDRARIAQAVNAFDGTTHGGSSISVYLTGEPADRQQIDEWKVDDVVFRRLNGFHQLFVSDETLTALRRYIAGYAGMASNVGGNLFRMLYLSVVVITTLGLGDIVPITTAARAAVGTEAVLGVVLIGFFFTSLSGSGGARDAGGGR